MSRYWLRRPSGAPRSSRAALISRHSRSRSTSSATRSKESACTARGSPAFQSLEQTMELEAFEVSIVGFVNIVVLRRQ
jgi:hypothetical protein